MKWVILENKQSFPIGYQSLIVKCLFTSGANKSDIKSPEQILIIF